MSPKKTVDPAARLPTKSAERLSVIPKDMGVSRLRNRYEVIYFNATQEDAFYSVEMTEGIPSRSLGRPQYD